MVFSPGIQSWLVFEFVLLGELLCELVIRQEVFCQVKGHGLTMVSVETQPLRCILQKRHHCRAGQYKTVSSGTSNLAQWERTSRVQGEASEASATPILCGFVNPVFQFGLGTCFLSQSPHSLPFPMLWFISRNGAGAQKLGSFQLKFHWQRHSKSAHNVLPLLQGISPQRQNTDILKLIHTKCIKWVS